MNNIEQLLTKLLEIHFLRPETALWRALDCYYFQREFYDKKLSGGVDLGCGDGTLSFLMSGGKVFNWDTYLETSNVKGHVDGADIHNTNPSLKLEIDQSELFVKFDLAVDLKDSLVKKALRFDQLYKDGFAQDLNDDFTIVGKKKFIFSNIFYWIDDLDKALKNSYSSLESGGQLILFVPNHNFKTRNWLYYSAPHTGDKKYLNYLDRGYSSLIKHCYSASEWEKHFKENGFKVKSHVPYMSKTITDIWNIGTRPITPLLISTTNRLSEKDRAEVRNEWKDYFKSFFLPILNEEINLTFKNDSDYAFHYYVLEKI